MNIYIAEIREYSHDHDKMATCAISNINTTTILPQAKRIVRTN